MTTETDVTILVGQDVLDYGTADALVAAIDAQLAASGAVHIDLDLRRVEFLDAYAIGKLITLRNALTQSQRTMHLSRLNREQLRVLAITGLLGVLATDPLPAGPQSQSG